MRILLTHAYTAANKGDAGIVAGMLSELRRLEPKSKIVISSMEEPGQNPYQSEGAITTQSLFYELVYRHPGLFGRVVSIGYYIPTVLIWSYVYGRTGKQLDFLISQKVRKAIDNYLQAELVVAVGGGYIRDKGSFQELIAISLVLLELAIPVMLGKKVYLYSQSIGPIKHSWMRVLTTKILNKVRIIYVREQISEKYLKQVGVRPELIRRGVDAGFLLTSKKDKARKVSRRRTVGITVRDWLAPTEQAHFEQAIAQIAAELVVSGKQIIFFPQVTATKQKDDDRVTAKRVLSKIKDKKGVSMITRELSYLELKEWYESLELFIGTRMHSNIFALTSYVPVIAIEYEHKTRGIMRELGLEEWVIKMEEVTYPRLKRMFDKLTLERETYITHLKKVMPSYINLARKPMKEIFEDYHVA